MEFSNEVAHWWLQIPDGCDVPNWTAYMTAAELGLKRDKCVLEPPENQPESEQQSKAI